MVIEVVVQSVCKFNRLLEVHDSELLLVQYQAMQGDMACFTWPLPFNPKVFM